MSNFYGLIGERLGHSFSHQIHNKIINKLGLKGSYNLFEIKRENLGKAIEGLDALGARGVNVTIPYKIDIMEFLDVISPEAEKIGAVNTIAFSEGSAKGYNTDYQGFGKDLKKNQINVYGKRAIVLGTGGASKAVIQYLLDNGISDVIYASRSPKKVQESIKNFKIISYEEIKELKNMDIIINSTPCGMYPDVESSPISKQLLSNFTTAVDLIYNPIETLFLKEAEKIGLKTANGLYMLVAQAVAAQEIWQGVKIQENVTDEIYEEIKELI